ncbi:MAG TPA: putative metal-binding motif-containing protein [Myxococcaceae bacterium]
MPHAARLAPLALATLVAGGCSQNAGLDLTVTIDAASRATCVRAFADFEDGSELSSQLIPRDGRGELRVLLFETRGLSRDFMAGAWGYYSRGGGCQPPLFINEEAAPQPSAFVSGKVVPLSVALALPAGMDADQDGFRASGGGGADCDDHHADVNVAASEVCGDGVDNDCSGAADCADPACAGMGGCESPEAACADGIDNDGDRDADCVDPDCEGKTCSDGNPCTVNDRCSGGICTVAPVICASPPGPCHEPLGSCSGDGGCVYTVDAGSTCAGGFCAYDGSCGALFRYTPANFTPPAIGMFALPQRFNCGTSTFDSSPGAANPFQTWCNQPTPPVIVTPQGGGIDAVVLPMRGLRVDNNNTLRLIGTRPVILAVFGDVTVDGTLNANGSGNTPGAGGNSPACGGSGVGGAGSAASSSGGGGGGGAFGGGGGTGGNSEQGAAGAIGGSMNGPITLSPFRGGCGGGTGGDSGGSGGGGGGGVQVSASDSMIIRGRVGAPGGGGQGGQGDQSGGGGGGSGGAILLEALSMTFTSGARVTVNGGGGGEGDNCCASGTWDGAGGGNGRNDNANTAGGGDTSGGTGGAGGAGGAGPTNAADGFVGTSATAGSATVRGGGGGGGGGVGRIRLNFTSGCAKDPAAIFSGAVTSNQASDAGCP